MINFRNYLTNKVIKILRKDNKIMNDKESIQKKSNKNNKCRIKCKNCQFYDRENNYCTEKNIKNCTKQFNADFSQCDSYLIRDNLVMY